MNPKDKEFLKLQKLWYDKLKKVKDKDYPNGFVDAERNDFYLKAWACDVSRYHTRDSFLAKEEYYRMAEKFLQEYPFKNLEEKTMWKLHSEGISIRNIAKKLTAMTKDKYERDKVHRKLKELTSRMKDQCYKKQT